MNKQTYKRMWDIKQSAEAPERLDIYIYGDVEENTRDWWSGQVIDSKTSADHFADELAKHPADQINIYINSYGGDVKEGTAIYNQLKRAKAHKTVYIDGFACSIASVIAMAGDEIIMPRNTLMMIHNMWKVAVGTPEELRKEADDLEVINEAGRTAYLDRAGDKLDAETLRQMQDDETWLTAEQCIALGLADRFADEDADMSKSTDILQRANAGLRRQSNALAAKLRQATSKPAPEPVPEPEPIKKPSIMEMLAGIK